MWPVAENPAKNLMDIGWPTEAGTRYCSSKLVADPQNRSGEKPRRRRHLSSTEARVVLVLSRPLLPPLPRGLIDLRLSSTDPYIEAVLSQGVSNQAL